MECDPRLYDFVGLLFRNSNKETRISLIKTYREDKWFQNRVQCILKDEEYDVPNISSLDIYLYTNSASLLSVSNLYKNNYYKDVNFYFAHTVFKKGYRASSFIQIIASSFIRNVVKFVFEEQSKILQDLVKQMILCEVELVIIQLFVKKLLSSDNNLKALKRLVKYMCQNNEQNFLYDFVKINISNERIYYFMRSTDTEICNLLFTELFKNKDEKNIKKVIKKYVNANNEIQRDAFIEVFISEVEFQFAKTFVEDVFNLLIRYTDKETLGIIAEKLFVLLSVDDCKFVIKSLKECRSDVEFIGDILLSAIDILTEINEFNHTIKPYKDVLNKKDFRNPKSYKY